MAIQTRELYRSPNGDQWCLARDSASGRVFIMHQANPASGGQATSVDVGAFLTQGGAGPEKQELLCLIGTLVEEPSAARSESSP